MMAHTDLVDRYKQIRAVLFRVNNRRVSTIPRETLVDCGRELGFSVAEVWSSVPRMRWPS